MLEFTENNLDNMVRKDDVHHVYARADGLASLIVINPITGARQQFDCDQTFKEIKDQF